MIEITTTRWDMVGGHMGIHNGRICVQGSMGYNMEGDADLTRGVTTRWGGRRVATVGIIIVNRDRVQKLTIKIK